MVIEDVFELHYVTHCCMGVSGVIAEFDAKGNLLLYSNTQVPFLHKREFAEILGMDPGRIRIIQPPIGGGFGSKLDIYPFEVICVFLARATGRPVKLVFSREEEFLASPTRQPVRLTLRSGCKGDGTLTFRTEFYDAFNHAQFANPALNASLGSFGHITSLAVNPRLIQFALKYAF